MPNEKSSDNASTNLPAIKEKLRELVHYASVSRLQVHTACSDVQFREMGPDFRPGRILANNMVFILVSSDALRITFKIHFNLEDGRHLAYRVFGGDDPEHITARQAIDYFKEYGNLVAGSIVTQFEKIDIGLGMSLPLCTRGFYEVFSDYAETEFPTGTYSDFWNLIVNDQSLCCSALIEILDKNRLQPLINLELIEPENCDDEEMDFL